MPDPLRAVAVAAAAGADGVTAHLREDRRHISDQDINLIRAENVLPLNLEMAATDEMVEFAIKYRPNFVCLVPEKREELTTEGGLNVDLEEVKKAIKELHKNNLKVCLFINPDINIVIRNSASIEDHVLSIDAYEINIIETIISLILLNPIPPKDLEMSADINDARDQQNAANRARK